MLTLILTRSGSNVDQAGDREQRGIKVSEILRYAKSVQAAIEQMKLTGISESDISFEHDGTYANAKCLVSDCKIFGAGGTGLNYKIFPDANDGSGWIFTGANNVGTTANPVGTTANATGNDLIMILPNVKQSLCEQINDDLNIGTAGTIPYETTGIGVTPFAGTYATGAAVVLDGDPAPFEFDGKETGCYATAGTPDTYHFYFVVLKR